MHFLAEHLNRWLWKRRGSPVVSRAVGEAVTHRSSARKADAFAYLFVVGLAAPTLVTEIVDQWLPQWANVTVYLVALIVAIALVVRGFRVAVTVSAEGFHVTNFFNSRHVGWSQIQQITRRPHRLIEELPWLTRGRPPAKAAVLVLGNGDEVFVSASLATRGTIFGVPNVTIHQAIEQFAAERGVPCAELDQAALTDEGVL